MEGQLYSLGVWHVKQGRERNFIGAWSDFAGWTARNQPGAIEGSLLQDLEDPRRFVSFGPWEDIESIRAWRERPEFKGFFAKAKELCERIEPQTLRLVARQGKS